MSRTLHSLFLRCLVGGSMVSAFTSGAAAQQRFVLDSAATRIWFEADATLGEFKGRAQRFRGWADVADLVMFAGTTGHVEIEVASFRTGNGMRDGHLRGDMKAQQYPLIVFELSDVEVVALEDVLAQLAPEDTAGAGERVPVRLRGRLTIRGVTRDVAIAALVQVAGDSIRARGRLHTRFTQFDMKPPSRIFGTVKVKDPIVLAFDALFRRGTP
jgi:polyisoprenoid-binding protein YceI